ncbi:hypothetical protein BH09VER1_BH09VER1_24370 [soil metagenome]
MTILTQRPIFSPKILPTSCTKGQPTLAPKNIFVPPSETASESLYFAAR